MIYVFLTLAAVLFAVTLRLSGTVPQVRFALAESRQAWATMAAAELSEEDKEIAVQRAAVRMFGSFLSILLRTALCVGVTAAFVALGAVAGLYDMEDVLRASANVYFLIGSTAVMIGAMLLVR